MLGVLLLSYVQHSAAARRVLEASAAAFAVGELALAVRGRRGAARSDVAAELVFRVVFLAAILAVPLGRALAPGATVAGGAWAFAAGALVGWSGLLLRWWSVLTLGRYFTTVLRTSKDQPVVDHGPYRLLRHPSYTGLLLVFAGGGVMVGNWLGATACVVILLAALAYRIRTEERALSAALGDRYRAFAAGRARLVPFLW
ncbi:isoprenylcysteine carboxylmethyltransferase family protein [Nocardioides pocheonensis]|uniref:Isoprenylcysteine carboxylmethyltransferase family protein n=1 Tax=Nocardioides pocheonensis TaxID=661485 RepID=A0A3N0GQK0_9ACTN|nr:isoprenylcysteine carboxylmethyltransferase family protein [Nocardioides pocheonensis]